MPGYAKRYSTNVAPPTMLPSVSASAVTCGSTAAVDSVELYADAGQSSGGTNQFRANGDSWIYNLDTTALHLDSKTLVRYGSRVAVVMQADGSV